MELEGKKIIVTGGGSGIAAGCVRGYVRAGAEVVFCDVNDEGGKTTEAAANAQEGVTGKATYFHCDITDKAAVQEFFAKAIEIMGGLDVLANIAGVERNKPAEDFEKDDIIRIINEDGESIGVGCAGYSSIEAQKLIGCRDLKPMVHYDYLYLD